MIRDGAGGPVPPGILSMMDVISRNSDRLRRLIEDMLTVSQQDSGNLNLKQVELGQVLRIVVAALRPLADSRNVTITGADSHEDVKVQADEAQLEQVFTNIVANAIKFTPKGGRISISFMTPASEAGSPCAVVDVMDTGVGIPEQEIAQVFTRFYRASNASSAAIPGSGLGLAIAYDIVRRHGGSLDLSSVLGEGTTVSVHLPVDGPRAEETDDDGADGDEAAGAPQTD
jgi:two-component system phosphate regulon sensor histidine kinase PhoR